MANTRSAAKRARQTIRRTAANRRAATGAKTQLKKVREALKLGDKAVATEAAREAVSTLDKAAKTGRIHKNKADRHKSEIAKALAAIK
jgi:small subunit ribosomal protein S20